MQSLALALAVPVAIGVAYRVGYRAARAREVVNTERAPAAIGPYSQGVKAGGLLFVSGQIPIDPATGEFSGSTIEAQAAQVMRNLRSIVEASGCSMQDVVKCTILLADIADFATVNEVYKSNFSPPYPARAAFAVKALPKGALVEIECVAALP
ncbi:hypothetical protein KFE25_010801 [Diacronema lutheri]|uniref:Uncharacterized protein n=2 Tax=Diacronema lutheri TaxID=2081491 RepID=A0A8J6C770_DIALT|nr:hypothetical protein KFE25_010801 [Diacronema lutheri]